MAYFAGWAPITCHHVTESIALGTVLLGVAVFESSSDS